MRCWDSDHQFYNSCWVWQWQCIGMHKSEGLLTALHHGSCISPVMLSCQQTLWFQYSNEYLLNEQCFAEVELCVLFILSKWACCCLRNFPVTRRALCKEWGGKKTLTDVRELSVCLSVQGNNCGLWTLDNDDGVIISNLHVIYRAFNFYPIFPLFVLLHFFGINKLWSGSWLILSMLLL